MTAPRFSPRASMTLPTVPTPRPPSSSSAKSRVLKNSSVRCRRERRTLSSSVAASSAARISASKPPSSLRASSPALEDRSARSTSAARSVRSRQIESRSFENLLRESRRTLGTSSMALASARAMTPSGGMFQCSKNSARPGTFIAAPPRSSRSCRVSAGESDSANSRAWSTIRVPAKGCSSTDSTVSMPQRWCSAFMDTAWALYRSMDSESRPSRDWRASSLS